MNSPSSAFDGRRGEFRRSPVVAVALVCLVAAAFLAPVGAGALPSQDDGQEIEEGTEYSGTLNDSRDVYEFTAEEGEYLRVATRSGPEAVEATLYAPSGEALSSLELYVDDLALGARAPESGKYRLVFEPADGNASGSGEYSFTVETTAPGDDEPNDQRSTATRLGGAAERNAVLGEGDVDWYALDADAGATIVAAVDRESALIGNDVAVSVVDSDGRPLAETETACAPGQGPCDPPELLVTVERGGTYYVRVASAGLSGYVPYGLRTEVRAPATPTESDRTDAAPTTTANDGSAGGSTAGPTTTAAGTTAATAATATPPPDDGGSGDVAPTPTESPEAVEDEQTTIDDETAAGADGQTATATAGGADDGPTTEDATPTDGPDESRTVGRARTTDADGPGFTAGLGFGAALLAALGALVRRRP